MFVDNSLIMIKLLCAFALFANVTANVSNDTSAADYAQDEEQRHKDEEEEAHSTEALEAQFIHYDLNKDGLLDAAEIRSAFGNKIDPAVLFQFFLRVDTDESGTMSKQEYLMSQAGASAAA